MLRGSLPLWNLWIRSSLCLPFWRSHWLDHRQKRNSRRTNAKRQACYPKYTKSFGDAPVFGVPRSSAGHPLRGSLYLAVLRASSDNARQIDDSIGDPAARRTPRDYTGLDQFSLVPFKTSSSVASNHPLVGRINLCEIWKFEIETARATKRPPDLSVSMRRL